MFLLKRLWYQLVYGQTITKVIEIRYQVGRMAIYARAAYEMEKDEREKWNGKS